MTTQVNFRIDESIKNKATKRAQKEGFSLSDICNHSLKAYAEGKIFFEMTTKEVLKDSVKGELKAIINDVHHGRNLSKRFTDTQELIQHLKNL